MSQWDDSTARYPAPVDDDVPDDEELYNPITYERDPYLPDAYAWETPESRPEVRPAVEPAVEPTVHDEYEPPTAFGNRGQGQFRDRGIWPDESWPPRLAPRPRRPRWFVPAAIVMVAAVAGITVALTSGGPAAKPAAAGRSSGPAASSGTTRAAPRTAPRSSSAPRPSTAPMPRPPITQGGAQALLASYTATNNTANTWMSDALLRTYETGSSYALDVGSYREQKAEKLGPYPAFGPIQTRFYIPLEPAAYPHWFAVQVTNAIFAKHRQPANVEYLVFTQAAPGAPWLDAAEPYVPHGGTTPEIALGADGFATAVTSGTTGLAVAPSHIALVTAESLDGDGPVPNPGSLADFEDAAYWHARLPKGTTVAVRHSPDDAGVFGLRTADGGALLFYTDAAAMTLTAPHGVAMHLAIPGFYDSAWSLSRATVGYLEQFATYDPPQGGASPHVVAAYSGITS